MSVVGSILLVVPVETEMAGYIRVMDKPVAVRIVNAHESSTVVIPMDNGKIRFHALEFRG